MTIKFYQQAFWFDSKQQISKATALFQKVKGRWRKVNNGNEKKSSLQILFRFYRKTAEVFFFLRHKILSLWLISCHKIKYSFWISLPSPRRFNIPFPAAASERTREENYKKTAAGRSRAIYSWLIGRIKFDEIIYCWKLNWIN